MRHGSGDPHGPHHNSHAQTDKVDSLFPRIAIRSRTIPAFEITDGIFTRLKSPRLLITEP